MSALGVVTPKTNIDYDTPLIPITGYTVVRGNFLGVLAVHTPPNLIPPRTADLGTYIVRQISIVYRQLWPYHGQRFPQ